MIVREIGKWMPFKKELRPPADLIFVPKIAKYLLSGESRSLEF